MKDYAEEIAAGGRHTVLASDHVDVCLPRMVVDANCKKSLPEGQFFNLTVSYKPSLFVANI